MSSNWNQRAVAPKKGVQYSPFKKKRKKVKAVLVATPDTCLRISAELAMACVHFAEQCTKTMACQKLSCFARYF